MDPTRVAFKGAEDLARLGIPDLDGLVMGTGHHTRPIRREYDGVNRTAVAVVCVQEFAKLDIPDLDSLVQRAGYELITPVVCPVNPVNLGFVSTDPLNGQ